MLASIENTIELRSFAVLPDFHRSGVGRLLAECIVQLAAQEGVDVFGNASTAGLPLYLRYGAEILGHVHLPTRKVQVSDKVVSLPDVFVPIMRWKLR